MKSFAKNYIIALLLALALIMTACAKNSADNLSSTQNTRITYGKIENLDLKKMCRDAGYEWMLMQPTEGGKIVKNSEDCWGCMVEGMYHFCSVEKYEGYLKSVSG